MRKDCEHCRNSRYVLHYFLEKKLDEVGVHLTEIPEQVFKQIPVELFFSCHCSAIAFSPSQRDASKCWECESTTWKLTENSKGRFGYVSRLIDLPLDSIMSLDCDDVERCPCGMDEQVSKPELKTKVFDALKDLRVNLPRLGLGF